MQVIRNGDPEKVKRVKEALKNPFKVVCEGCDCEFSFGNSDTVQRTGHFGTRLGAHVICPCCNSIIPETSWVKRT